MKKYTTFSNQNYKKLNNHSCYIPLGIYMKTETGNGKIFTIHVDTLVGYNFQKEKSLPASFKPQEILWLMLTFWK